MSHYDYSAGTDPVVEVGAMRAFGTRVLCRAILTNDGYRGPLHLVTYNSTDAECFEVLSVGGGVAGWCESHGESAPRPGQHLDCRSTAADRVAQKDPTGRFWLVPIEDVTAVWDPVPLSSELADAVIRTKDRRNNAPSAAAPLGAIELEPR